MTTRERVKYLSESGFTGFEDWQDFMPIKKKLSALSCWLPTRNGLNIGSPM
jgi:hypothetical protein